MQVTLTSEQVLSLAVDKHALRTSRAWSAREKWLRIGQDQGIAWGEFKGKSKKPIQTMVSLKNPLFSCTCTGRKLPCSHALGLRLLFFESPHLFHLSVPSVSSQSTSSDSESSEPVTSSGGWCASLSESSLSSTLLDAPFADNSTAAFLDTPITEPVSDNLDTARLQRIRNGLNELDLWLGDVVRNGLESVRDKKRASDWQRVARRLVDAQASELASSVRELSTIPRTTAQWPEELLAKMGILHLLIQGFHNYENLPAEVQGDLRLAVGWLPKIETSNGSILSENLVADRWHVMARQPVHVGKQRRYKIWLWGEKSNRPALVVRILPNKQKEIEDFLPGTALEGNLYFYPSMAPMRAEFIGNLAPFPPDESTRNPRPMTIVQPDRPSAGYANFEEAFQAVNHSATQNPWRNEFPLLIRSALVKEELKAKVNAASRGNGKKIPGSIALYNLGRTTTPYTWYITDETGIRLSLPSNFEYGWHLKALNQQNNIDKSKHGAGLHLFGVWDRTTFRPYSVWQGGRWLSLHILKGEL